MNVTNFLLFITILSSSFVQATCESNQVDINTASLSELDKLDGIGQAFAQDIIDARPYSSVEDLDKAKNIGPARLQKIKDQGLACIGSDIEKPTLEEAGTSEKEEITEVEEKIDFKEEINSQEVALTNPTGESIINLNSDSVLEKNSEIIYQSKNELVKKYSIYAFALFLIVIIIILLVKR